MKDTIKLFCCDLNWSMINGKSRVSAAQDWAYIDPEEYFEWHRVFGNNVMFCQAYTFGGYAFYPTELGPVAPGPGSRLLPSLYSAAHAAGMPFWSYFCVGTEHISRAMRPDWTIPGSKFFDPESPWTDLLCARVREFLNLYPVDWILFDWFVYGGLKMNGTAVEPTSHAKNLFEQIVGRPMPETSQEIAEEEQLTYKREVLARQFFRIRDAVKETSPQTQIVFNVPYREANGALWKEHPMVKESDGLFSECTDDRIMEWLLSVRRHGQRVMTNLRGQAGRGLPADPRTWKKWHDRGCDFFGYAWGKPPDFQPVADYQKEVNLVRKAFCEMH
jgi:hypothetical protein